MQEFLTMFVTHNVIYFVVVVLALGLGTIFGRSLGVTASNEAVAKAIAEQREFAVKANVGQYIVDPLTGNTGFTYANLPPK
jgi:hypothetical protein